MAEDRTLPIEAGGGLIGAIAQFRTHAKLTAEEMKTLVSGMKTAASAVEEVGKAASYATDSMVRFSSAGEQVQSILGDKSANISGGATISGTGRGLR